MKGMKWIKRASDSELLTMIDHSLTEIARLEAEADRLTDFGKFRLAHLRSVLGEELSEAKTRGLN